jgi:hypothetical protein
MAGRGRTPPGKPRPQTSPASREARADIVHSSVYLPEAVHEALRGIAFRERIKIHDIILEGIDLALRKRGYIGSRRKRFGR